MSDLPDMYAQSPRVQITSARVTAITVRLIALMAIRLYSLDYFICMSKLWLGDIEYYSNVRQNKWTNARIPQ